MIAEDTHTGGDQILNQDNQPYTYPSDDQIADQILENIPPEVDPNNRTELPIQDDLGLGLVLNENYPPEYEVDEYGKLKKGDVKGDNLENHHVPQKALAKDVVDGYPTDSTASSAPAIRLSKKDHSEITRMQNKNKEARQSMTPRELLADDARMLREIDVPNAQIIEILNQNKIKYGFKK